MHHVMCLATMEVEIKYRMFHFVSNVMEQSFGRSKWYSWVQIQSMRHNVR